MPPARAVAVVLLIIVVLVGEVVGIVLLVRVRVMGNRGVRVVSKGRRRGMLQSEERGA
jgi:hypothetical protein